MEFFSLEPKSFGIDFSDLRLRLADLEKKKGFFDLSSWGSVDIPRGIIKEGEIQNADSLTEYIKGLVSTAKGKKIKTKHVVASLPERKSFMQIIKVAKMEEEDLETAVLFEAENYVPLPLEEVYLDFQVLPFSHKPRVFNVLIAAVPKEIVDQYVLCLRKAGLIPVAFEVESQSIVRALIKNEISSGSLFVIDFGRSTTSLIIFSGSSIRFTSSIPLCSQDMTAAISKNIGVGSKEAEKLKIKHGFDLKKKNAESRKVADVINPLAADLVRQAKKYITYYQSHSSGSLGDIEKIILCGQGSSLKGLPDFISSGLKIPVEIGNPWINIMPMPFKKIPGITLKESLGYTTALGLALRGVKKYD